MKAATKAPKHAGLIVKRVRFADTEPHPENPRIHPPEGSPEYNRLKTSLANEYFDPLVWNKRNGKMVSGHFRRTILMAEGFATADMVVVDWDEKTHKARMIAANELLGKYDEAKLLALVRDGGLDADLTGLTDEKIRSIIAAAEPPPAPDLAAARLTLSQRFGVPPFSVLDARQGYWQERKRAWLALGIRSEIGRGDNLLKMSETIKEPDPNKRAAKKAAATNTTDWVKSKGLSGLAQNIPGTDEQWSGTSIFDPVLCELAYRWYCPVGGAILDPFAGGSVRGIVAGMLGRQYVGVDLRAEQVEANKEQARRIIKPAKKKAPAPELVSDPAAMTPVEKRGKFWFKRDDLFSVGGVRGGKVRTCLALSKSAKGLVTAGSRQSPQVNIVSSIAKHLGIPARIHTPQGELSPEVQSAVAKGAEIFQHKAGYNNVIIKAARDDAKATGFAEIPFGMECPEAIEQTRRQVQNLPKGVKRLIVPVGSAMSVAGILTGLNEYDRKVQVIGVQVGADPTERLDQFAPKNWREIMTLVKSELDYHDPAPVTEIEGVQLDPIYEAKCLPFVQPGDCLWIVGVRETAVRDQPDPIQPMWITGDSIQITQAVAGALNGEFDFLWTCPPYFDLEVYSDDPRDLSTAKTYEQFRDAMTLILARCGKLMKPNSFAGIVIGDIRDEAGIYRNFVSDTIAAFRNAGWQLYNEAILVTSVGSLPIRAAKQFESSRKLGKTHQNVLFFVKGDPRKATAKIGAVEFGAVPVDESSPAEPLP